MKEIIFITMSAFKRNQKGMRLFMQKLYGKELLEKELKGSYLFFIRENNFSDKGYGLIHDETVHKQNITSIASVGYGFCALVVGVVHGYLKYDEAKRIATKTLDTILNELENENGFYYHFIKTSSKKSYEDYEISIIDTALLLCGAILAGEFFKGVIKEKATIIYEKANWRWFLDDKSKQFYISYLKNEGFSGRWSAYAEQLMIYILAIASPTFNVDKDVYDYFDKPKADYGNIKNIVYSHCGSLFTYQYSHAFFDFKNKKDKNGIDWFENSVKATFANRQYCIDNMAKYKTYSENAWGLTACLTPTEYNSSIGAEPCNTNLDVENDGTVATSGAIGSIVFTPKYSIKAMENYYNNFPELWSDYGFNNSFNFEGDSPWFAHENLGIDKGIGLCMIENYLNGSIWKYFMKNEFVQKGMGEIFQEK